MFKKVIVGILFVGLIAVLVVGAINRMSSKDRGSDDVLGESETSDLSGTVEAQEDSSTGQQSGAGSGASVEDQSGGSGNGTSQAVTHEWLELEGEIVGVDEIALSISLTGGGDEILDTREWQFAQEKGFSVAIGDHVVLYGFYQEGDFKPGKIDNLSNGQSVVLRNLDGKPLWAGGGKGGE